MAPRTIIGTPAPDKRAAARNNQQVAPNTNTTSAVEPAVEPVVEQKTPPVAKAVKTTPAQEAFNRLISQIALIMRDAQQRTGISAAELILETNDKIKELLAEQNAVLFTQENTLAIQTAVQTGFIEMGDNLEKLCTPVITEDNMLDYVSEPMKAYYKKAQEAYDAAMAKTDGRTKETLDKLQDDYGINVARIEAEQEAAFKKWQESTEGHDAQKALYEAQVALGLPAGVTTKEIVKMLSGTQRELAKATNPVTQGHLREREEKLQTMIQSKATLTKLDAGFASQTQRTKDALQKAKEDYETRRAEVIRRAGERNNSLQAEIDAAKLALDKAKATVLASAKKNTSKIEQESEEAAGVAAAAYGKVGCARSLTEDYGQEEYEADTTSYQKALITKYLEARDVAVDEVAEGLKKAMDKAKKKYAKKTGKELEDKLDKAEKKFYKKKYGVKISRKQALNDESLNAAFMEAVEVQKQRKLEEEVLEKEKEAPQAETLKPDPILTQVAADATAAKEKLTIAEQLAAAAGKKDNAPTV